MLVDFPIRHKVAYLKEYDKIYSLQSSFSFISLLKMLTLFLSVLLFNPKG
jgi:hypothetical protein